MLMALPSAVRAQDTGDGFLFRTPNWGISLRGGVAVPRARSEVFDFTSELLTLNRRDFASFSAGFDLERRLLDWTHLIFSIDGANVEHDSEFREYVDNNDLPIEQTTQFTRLNISIGIKQYIIRPGRSIGKLAWVPSRVAPFVAGGVGATHYDFKQNGDFVDFEDLDVFTAQFRSKGWTRTAHLRGGLDYSLSPHVSLTVQGRYDWSNGAKLSRDFAGFDRIDLSGYSTTTGFTVRF